MKLKNKTKAIKLISSVLIIGSISVGAMSCTKTLATDTPKKEKEMAIPVKVENIEKTTIAVPIRIAGNISATKERRLSFKTGGIIKTINADAGDKVKKGKVLAQLDLKEINQQVLQAKTAVDKAKRDFQRAENLYNDTVTTLEQYQNAKSALDLAISQLNIAEYNLQHSTIYAPTNGIILRKFMEENEITGTGTPIFYFASATESWKMTTGISDKDVVKLKFGDNASITIDAYPNKKLNAKVSQIANAPDLTTGLFEVELSIENTSLNLKPGFFAKGDIFPSEKIACYKFPVNAVQEGVGNTITFFTFNDKTNKAQKEETTVLFLMQDYLYVNSINSLTSAMVITHSQKELRHNDYVIVNNNQLANSN